MQNLQAFKQEINEILGQSILLEEKMRLAIKAKVATCTDVDTLKYVYSLLLREKEYIIKYLQQVIHVDTTGLTVYKLREIMQRSFLRSIQEQEVRTFETDRQEANDTIGKISL